MYANRKRDNDVTALWWFWHFSLSFQIPRRFSFATWYAIRKKGHFLCYLYLLFKWMANICTENYFNAFTSSKCLPNTSTGIRCCCAIVDLLYNVWAIYLRLQAVQFRLVVNKQIALADYFGNSHKFSYNVLDAFWL